MRHLFVLVLLCLTACAPVREQGTTTLPPCDDDAFEPDDSQNVAFDMGNGGNFARIVCPGDEDWLSFQLGLNGYGEVYFERSESWNSLIELQDAAGNVLGSSEQQSAPSFWLSVWQEGTYYVRLALERDQEAEPINLNAYVGDDIVVGELTSPASAGSARR